MRHRIHLCAFTLALRLTSTGASAEPFTYQGQLDDGGVPASGSYDLRFELFGTVIGGVNK